MRSVLAGLAAISLAVSACGRGSDDIRRTSASHELMRVGDSVLTRGDVEVQIPGGLSAEDSARMFDAIAETWLERSMLVDMSGSNIPDLDKIDRMVEQYRLQLLANEYRRAMARDHAKEISQDSIKAYYEAHPEQFMLDEPALKGIYVKVSAQAPQLDRLRKWMKDAHPSDIDALETYGLKGAMEYDYFGDTWVDWHMVADRIPYRFGDAGSFVESHNMFETESDGTVYMLRILDYVPSGQIMPIELAQSEIADRLTESSLQDYDRQLLLGLYARGVRQKRIVPGSYVPVKYRGGMSGNKQ